MVVGAPVCDFGWKARDFSLPGIDGRTYGLAEIVGARGTLIMFICNHCPYVRAVIGRIVAEAAFLQSREIGVAAIMPNDTAAYPADGFDQMAEFAAVHRFSFPYLFDDSQAVGRAYDAQCTPDFFGFNAELELQYRGRLDASGAGPEQPGARRELADAMVQIADTGRGPAAQTASMGCSIKWRRP